ncbi:hypothetical protein CKO09_11620 [Chromatium weissei]|nr:hypothetical protein [Chromatium weissei]
MYDEYGYFTNKTTRQQYREYRKLARWWMSNEAAQSGDHPGYPPNDVYWAFTNLFLPLKKDPLDYTVDPIPDDDLISVFGCNPPEEPTLPYIRHLQNELWYIKNILW